MRLKSILESLIFASDRPITVKQLKELTATSKTETLTAALEDLEAEYRESGVQLAQVGGGYQFRTHPDNATWVKRLLAGRPPRLTRAMLETLAIVAYRQPITRPEIEDIRGVDSGGVIRILLERGLIRIMGKKEEVGRPILYGTTRQFLEFFNLRDLRELPTLKEFTELTEEHADQVEGRFGEPEAEEPAEQAEAAAAEPDIEGEPEAAVEEPGVAEATGEPAEQAEVAAAEPDIEGERSAEAPEVEPGVAEPPDVQGAAHSPKDAPAGDVAQVGVEAAPEAEAAGVAPALDGPAPVPSERPEEGTYAAGVATPEPAEETEEQPAAAGTFPAGTPPPGVAESEEDEDAALAALDRALDRVNTVLRAHRQMYPEQKPPPGDGEEAAPGGKAAEGTAPAAPDSGPDPVRVSEETTAAEPPAQEDAASPEPGPELDPRQAEAVEEPAALEPEPEPEPVEAEAVEEPGALEPEPEPEPELKAEAVEEPAVLEPEPEPIEPPALEPVVELDPAEPPSPEPSPFDEEDPFRG